MITKGIVISIEGNMVKIRMPFLDGLADSQGGLSDNELAYATICTASNTYNTVSIGDIVFVGFEDNDLGKPIILGCLFKDIKWEDLPSNIDTKIRYLLVSERASLTADTTIGEVNGAEISMLKGCKANIQEQLNNIVSLLQQQIDELKQQERT